MPGSAATFAVWDTPAGLADSGLPVLAADTPLPACRLTVLRGQNIFESTFEGA